VTSILSLPDPVVAMLVGPSGSGKSTWALQHFAANQVISSDALRASSGRGEDDLGASADAFALLRTVLAMRCKRKLSSVVDTLGFDESLRSEVISEACKAGLPVVAVVMDTPSQLCRSRNAERGKRIPVAVLNEQFTKFQNVRELVLSESFTSIHVIEPHERVTAPVSSTSVQATSVQATRASSSTAVDRSQEGVRFGLHLSSFPWPAEEHRARLTELAQAAEAAGFDSLWVMDHFRQIPQVGREWDAMHEALTTLAFLAGVTTRLTLSPLVAAVTHRNIGVFGKAIATLDVVSGGRAVCGLGLGWNQVEHEAFGIGFPSTSQRYELLRDALIALPLLWGKGSPRFDGAAFQAASLMAYPRPLQARIPLLVGGSGEKRTLKLVAELADACNLFGELPVIAKKVAVLRSHCVAVDRDPETVEVTHLSTAIVADTPGSLSRKVDGLNMPEKMLKAQHPGTITDHVQRVLAFRAAGVQHSIISMPGITVDDIGHFAQVIDQVRSNIDPATTNP
jgi:alkanesulfonate monooxygenase SsuD/methylene tetrahydromethanopterin reductase-like flavin-dependent oxidoreductase (luciferase family)/predicted kinase